jgi:hypothetical protein
LKKNKYNLLLSKISVPEDLKKQVLEEASREVLRRKQPFYRFRKPVIGVCAAAVMVLLFVTIWPFSGKDNFIQSNLSNTGYLEYVKLTDGYLDFSPTSPQLDGGLNFGTINPLKEQWSLEEYSDYLGKDIAEPSYLPKKYVKSQESFTAFYTTDGRLDRVEGSFQYQEGSNGYITLITSDTPIQSQVVFSNTNLSQIGSLPVSTGYDKTLNRYSASFELETVRYLIFSEGLSQKEFIKVLYSICSDKAS